MIGFKEAAESNTQFTECTQILDRLDKTPSSYQVNNSIQVNMMKELNKLFGKYFNMPKKQQLKIIKEKNKAGYYGNGERIEFSKAGMGHTGDYSVNINPYYNLITGKDNHSFIGEVIKDDFVFEEARKCMSDNGKAILDDVKETYNKYKPSYADKETIKLTFKPTNEERQLLNLIGDKEYTLTLSDSGQNLRISLSKDANANSWRSSETFDTSDVSEKPQDFLFRMFIQYHAAEMNKMVDDYIAYHKIEDAKWRDFDTELREHLAKYLLLEKI